MTETRGESRAETAKQNDDSELTDRASDETLGETAQEGSKGGGLQTDLGSQVDEARTGDPDAHRSVKKGDHIAHGQHTDEPHSAQKVVTER